MKVNINRVCFIKNEYINYIFTHCYRVWATPIYSIPHTSVKHEPRTWTRTPLCRSLLFLLWLEKLITRHLSQLSTSISINLKKQFTNLNQSPTGKQQKHTNQTCNDRFFCPWFPGHCSACNCWLGSKVPKSKGSNLTGSTANFCRWLGKGKFNSSKKQSLGSVMGIT